MSANIKYSKGFLTITDSAPAIARHLLVNAMEDIAAEIERKAKELAPKGDTRELKKHPVDVQEVRIRTTGTANAQFGGGFSVQGAGGRFIKGAFTPGELVAEAIVSVAQIPKYAVFVHQGTGVYGKKGKPYRAKNGGYMRFFWKGKFFRLKQVRGQKANPFLENAYLATNRSYVNVRVERLRAEIQALT